MIQSLFKISHNLRFLIAALLISSASSVQADVQLPNIFSDSMVLQRDQESRLGLRRRRRKSDRHDRRPVPSDDRRCRRQLAGHAVTAAGGRSIGTHRQGKQRNQVWRCVGGRSLDLLWPVEHGDDRRRKQRCRLGTSRRTIPTDPHDQLPSGWLAGSRLVARQ